PGPQPLNLPLGGLPPTEREIASARALIVGWIAASSIAAFAFLAQGPSLTARPAEAAAAPAPSPVVPAAPASQPGGIRLDPAAAPKAVPARAKRTSREPAPSPLATKP